MINKPKKPGYYRLGDRIIEVFYTEHGNLVYATCDYKCTFDVSYISTGTEWGPEINDQITSLEQEVLYLKKENSKLVEDIFNIDAKFEVLKEKIRKFVNDKPGYDDGSWEE
jgi:hypothetical protein